MLQQVHPTTPHVADFIVGVYSSIQILVRGFKTGGMDILEDISICFVDDGGLMVLLRSFVPKNCGQVIQKAAA